MQLPTCTGLRVRTTADAHIIFHAVSLNILPIVSRRLDTDERRSISSGCVYVWEERGPNTDATGVGIERWTDSIRWGPSRVRDEFLFYHEKEATPTGEHASDSDAMSPQHTKRGIHRDNLIKQTYSVFIETPRGRRKWHLIAYFTQESLDYLRTIDDLPHLASLSVPLGRFRTARSVRPRPHNQDFDLIVGSSQNPYHTQNPSEYPQYYMTYGSEPPTRSPVDVRSNRPQDYLISRSTLPHNRASDILAPLAYLQNIPPPRRHPMDEEALMSFTKRPCWTV
ncbi:cAMP-independent regulatory protein pac2 [Hypsizygus marmoreus]|uniref:cAMP-independent regulatory protein pac2 n=1 Tax=Hypsizygus marmoreus TaxID=39966 RepID=A0A369JY45_HYPMA|nr:cAMP-independent regulatory protein pac2 [Hypsizygus marmoreus]